MELSKKGKNGILFGLAGLGLFIIGWTYRQYYLLYNAAIKLKGAVIHSLTINKVSFTLYIEINNTGDLSVDVTNQIYDIYVGDLFIMSVTNSSLLHINSNGKTLIPLKIDLTPQNLLIGGLQNLTSILIDRNKFIIKIKGRLSFTAGIVSMKDFDLNMIFTLQEIIDLSAKPNPDAPKPLIQDPNKPLIDSAKNKKI